jgi:hypothetical protein
VEEASEGSPMKSLKPLSGEVQVPRSTCQRVMRKAMKMCPYRGSDAYMRCVNMTVSTLTAGLPVPLRCITLCVLEPTVCPTAEYSVMLQLLLRQLTLNMHDTCVSRTRPRTFPSVVSQSPCSSMHCCQSY